LTRVTDVYRKLRNTCRILVANLYDFDPASDAVPFTALDELDRFALARFAAAAARVRHAYDEYEFATAAQTLNMLASVDLSAFYVDVTKDRMYTLGATSRERRSTQTAMYTICDGLARLLAPILPVTAETLWQYLPGRRGPSVHLEGFADTTAYADAALESTWTRLLEVREQVLAALEDKRKAKIIGTSLGARVHLTASGAIGSLLESHRDTLPTLFIVSEVALTVVPGGGTDRVDVEVEKAPGTKCERCWRFVPSIHAEPEWAGLCDRCVDALAETVNR
jgi:isoleucyl-tRNA synthetase